MSEEIKPANTTEMILRFPERDVTLLRSFVPLYLSLFFITFGTSILLGLVVMLLLAIFPYPELILGTAGLVAVGLVIGNFFLVRQYSSVKYLLKPGYMERINNEMINQISGKVIITRGFMFSFSNVILTKELARVSISKSFFGNMFNYGNIILQEVDNLTDTQDFYLIAIQNPMEAAGIIQKMISIDQTNPQILH